MRRRTRPGLPGTHNARADLMPVRRDAGCSGGGLRTFPALHRRHHGARGMGLVELMVAVALGLGISLVALSLLVSARNTYTRLNDAALMRDAGQLAVDLIARSLRQAGWADLSQGMPPVAATTADTATPAIPAVSGYDAASLVARSGDTVPTITPGNRLNGSDVLLLHFDGSGKAGRGDGSVINCAGFGVGAAAAEPSGLDAGWSSFHVATGSDGVPSLRCHYRGTRAGGAGAWQSDTVVPGVEDFQVLYGLDENNDGQPDRYLNATAIRARDRAASASSGTAGAPVAASAWQDVVAVRFALIIRGEMPAVDAPFVPFDLFGREYSVLHAGDDPGVQFRVPEPSSARPVRRVYGATVYLRNRAAVRAAAA